MQRETGNLFLSRDLTRSPDFGERVKSFVAKQGSYFVFLSFYSTILYNSVDTGLYKTLKICQLKFWWVIFRNFMATLTCLDRGHDLSRATYSCVSCVPFRDRGHAHDRDLYHVLWSDHHGLAHALFSHDLCRGLYQRAHDPWKKKESQIRHHFQTLHWRPQTTFLLFLLISLAVVLYASWMLDILLSSPYASASQSST